MRQCRRMPSVHAGMAWHEHAAVSVSVSGEDAMDASSAIQRKGRSACQRRGFFGGLGLFFGARNLDCTCARHALGRDGARADARPHQGSGWHTMGPLTRWQLIVDAHRSPLEQHWQKLKLQYSKTIGAMPNRGWIGRRSMRVKVDRSLKPTRTGRVRSVAK